MPTTNVDEILKYYMDKNSDKGTKHALQEYFLDVVSYPFVEIGLNFYLEENYSEAIKIFADLIKVNPNNPFSYLMRGTSYEDFGDDDSAEIDFKKALEIHPYLFTSAYRLGMVYYRRADIKNAIIWLKYAYENSVLTEIDYTGWGDNSIIFIGKHIIANNLGSFLINDDKIEEGFYYLQKAMELSPSYGAPHFTLGLAFQLRLNDIPNAIICYENAIALGVTKAQTRLDFLKSQAR